jgi:hypothetical protein
MLAATEHAAFSHDSDAYVADAVRVKVTVKLVPPIDSIPVQVSVPFAMDPVSDAELVVWLVPVPCVSARVTAFPLIVPASDSDAFPIETVSDPDTSPNGSMNSVTEPVAITFPLEFVKVPVPDQFPA